MIKSKRKSADRVLITGASTGIGEGLARRFAHAGHDLVLVARSADKLESLATEIRQADGVNVMPIAADLAKPNAAARLAATLKRRRLPIDILVNNAGINLQGHFSRISAPAHQDLIALNVSATTDMLSHFIPPMIERGHGRVLNISSTSAFLPVPFMATYAASKAYLLSLSESLAEELKGSGVTMSVLCPGVTATPMMDTFTEGNPLFTSLIGATVLQVEEVSNAGYKACMAGRVDDVPGRVNLITALSSRAIQKWAGRRLMGILGRASN
jgi:short-subunit dehydrogenase